MLLLFCPRQLEKSIESVIRRKSLFIVDDYCKQRLGLGEVRQIFLSFRPSRTTNIFLFNREVNTAQALPSRMLAAVIYKKPGHKSHNFVKSLEVGR